MGTKLNNLLFGILLGGSITALLFILQLKNQRKFYLLNIQELNHRIKNHLTIIIYIIKLYQKNENKLDALISLENKVFAISAIYNHMNASDDFLYVNAKEYYVTLTDNIIKCLNTEEKKINYIFECSNLTMNSKQAIHLAIIINELILNSYKHGLVETNKHTIFISLTKKYNKFYFTYKDNGTGLIKVSKTGFGTYMINAFITSLKANMTCTNINGLEYEIVF
ncbi:two-component system sensor histidine kinase [Arcobacter venerupis]|uniref:histidine kinase n=1 Tax=Arcobacter venerupis TaxID=1054033 RepID=A0AAE7BDS7_9BACT|nr:two-component system sensor histidine kinase [Arcobacter venerupis]RWS48194.1 hypothetical protein CKA56_15395 [Arcobacter venerupis]